MARILIAEDNAALAHRLSEQMKRLGHTAIVAASALDAWRKIGSAEEAVFDALVVNVVMPGIDGFILAQRALVENPDMKVVFLTGFAAVAMDTYATPSYAPAPFTSRPFHVSELAARLNGIFRGVNPMIPAPEQTRNEAQNTVIYAKFGAQKG